MSHSHAAAMGLSVLKRSMSGNFGSPDEPNQPDAPTYNLPPLTWGLVALVTLIFIPAYIYTSYSIKSVYTTLAIVENPNPAAYEAVANDENDAAPAAVPAADDAADEEAAAQAAGPNKPVTASIRRTYKLLRAAGGWRGNYRGFWLSVLIFILAAVGTVVLSAIPFLPGVVGGLFVALGLVQLQTAWVHRVIRATPATTPVWRNLPPFRRTFEATSIPTFLQWAASVVTTLVSVLVTRLLKLDKYDIRNPNEVPAYSNNMIWKTIVVFLVAIVLVFALTIPANVVLVRVQASLLPPDEDTVVPFDRSFNGTVEPAVVGGRSFVTIRDAFRTFSRASWKRVYLLYIKYHVLSVAINVLYLAIVVPIVVLTSKKVDPSN